MFLERDNVWVHVRRAPAWFIEYAARHLSVCLDTPIMPTQPTARFGSYWRHHGQVWGSLMHHDRASSGLVPHLLQLARHYGLPATLLDARVRPDEGFPLGSVRMAWRPYQEGVFRAMLAYERGVIDAPPRSGKTAMAARALDTFNLPAAIIAPSVQIVAQTFRVLREHFGEDYVSRFDGAASDAERDPEKPFCVLTAASAVSMSQDWWDTRKMLIVDEFHHSAAETTHRISALARNAYYRWGLTGTHFRTGGDRLAMDAIASRAIYRIPIPYLVRESYLAAPVVRFVTIPEGQGRGGSNFQTAYQRNVVEHETRNAWSAALATRQIDAGVPTLVLVRRRAHADALAAAIPGAAVAKGGANALTSRTIADFNAGEIPCVVGTTVIGEGVDIPRAGALIYAAGGRAGVAMLQSYFRPLTAHPGKSRGLILDFVDTHHGMLQGQSDSRRAMATTAFGSAGVETLKG